MQEDAMRTCPVCGAESFADMETCYSCLHVFGAEKTRAAEPFSASAELAVPDSDGAFIPEEAVAPAMQTYGVSAGVPAGSGENPVQLRIVIDVSGMGSACFQKS